MEIKNILQSIGMSEIETNLYLTNLELGRAPVSNIAKRSGIKRTTLYPILDAMTDKFWLTKHFKNNVIFYEATDPDDVYKKFEKELSHFHKNLPELRALNNTSFTKPKILYYEGLDNVAKIYEMEVMDQPEEVKILSANIDRRSGENDILRQKRNEIYTGAKKSKMKLILNRVPYKNEKNWELFESKTILPEALNIETSIKIYADKVIFLSTKDGYQGIVIENRAIARTMESLFDYIYRVSH